MARATGLNTEDVVRLFDELGSMRATADSLGVRLYTVQYHLKKAGYRAEASAEALEGLIQNKKPIVLPLKKKGVTRYLISCAQNNTLVNGGFMDNLEALAEFYDAEILISRFTYNKSRYGNRSVKPGTDKASDYDDLWYDKRIEPYVCDDRVKLAPGLVFVGDMNDIPTSVRPLSGLESFTGSASGIFPHPKVAMASVPTPAHDPTKFNYTTGTVTRRNYIQKKAGMKAEFHHVYGALLVEVEPNGDWWVRRVSGDGRNRICDLDVIVNKGVVEHNPDNVEAFTPGDIHAVEMDPDNARACWGEEGVVDTLRPKKQIIHDLFDMRSRSHHDFRSFHRMYEKHVRGEENVYEELKETVKVCTDLLSRPWMQTYVVPSNHNEHLEQWLDRFDYRDDLVNAKFFLKAQIAKIEAIENRDEKFSVLEWALRNLGLQRKHKFKFLGRDEKLITCPKVGNGIENNHHGDKAANGARGSIMGFVRMAIKIIIGHSHTAGTIDGVDQVGTSSLLRLPYTVGPSSWSHTHCLTYFNGKRTLFTVWNGKPWADRSDLWEEV